jgi:Leucine-rich repeat (LRR) protein
MKLLLPLVCVALVLPGRSTSRADDPEQPLSPIEGVPRRYWFIYEGNWPFEEKEEARARSGIPFARISLDAYGDNHVPGGHQAITLCRDGTACFEGEPGARREGRYTGSVSVIDYGRLCLLIERLQFRRLPEDIRPNLRHGSHHTTAIVRVHRVGEKNPIENDEWNGCGPIELFAIQSAIEKVAESIDWQKNEKPATDRQAYPVFTGELLAALNSLSGLTELKLSGYWAFNKEGRRLPNTGPGQLGSLTHLERLDLSRTNLEDGDLKDLGRFRDLRSLDVNMQILSKGATFGALRSLPKLTALRVQWPPVEGIELKEVVRFEQLKEFNGYFGLPGRGDDQSQLSKLRHLERLDLSSSEISPELFAGITGLTALKSLDLAGFGPEVRLRQLRELPSLERLNLSGENVNQSHIEALKELPSLKDLDLSLIPLGAGELGALGRLVQLERLNLSKTTLTDIGLAHVKGLHNLKQLDLFWNEITDFGVKELTGFEHLETLRLARTRITDDALKILSWSPSLSELDISATDVTDSGVKQLQMLPRLERLSISGPYITDEGIKELSKLTRLRQLTLSGTRMTDAGLESLKSLSRLTRLDVDATRITDRALKALRTLTALEELNLDATRVTDAGMKELAGMKNLRRLTLSGPRITEPGLKNLAASPTLTHLKLAGCRLTPGALRALASLKTLKSLALVQASGSCDDPTTCAE